MRRRPLRRLAAAAVALGSVAVAAGSHRAGAVAEGPEPGFTGGFGEPTCTACHFDAPPEPEEGALLLEGVPERYEPGEEYPLRLTLRDPRLERGGFQLSVRFSKGEEAGRQAGRLAAEGDPAEVVEHGEPPVLYARQTLEGARPVASHEVAWTLHWTAPAAAGPVVFHAAANAANHDDSEFGDVIHTATARSEPAGPYSPR